jgi:uncharacterized membrane protein
VSGAPAVRPGTASPRKHWLDWERGLAVLFMVEVHTLDAWLAPGAGRGLLHDVLTMVGGFAAPSFLFMAGLSQVLGDSALARRGVVLSERRRKALSRAIWLLGVAYAFRLGEYALGGMFRVAGGWQDILRVDVLNVIALSLVAGALLLSGVPRSVHFAAAVLVAAAIAFGTPVVAAWRHPPSRVLDYLFASYPRANFCLFNWAAFLFAGSAVGRLVAERNRPVLLAALGAGLFAAGWGGDSLPAIYEHQDFWHTSPSWFAMRLGVIVALTGILQLISASADAGLSWLRTMGRHSLLGYLASIELTYGRLSAPLHQVLSLVAVLAAIVLMIALTWGMSVAADSLAQRRRRLAAGAGGAPWAAA